MIRWHGQLPQFVRRDDFQVEAIRSRISFEPDEGDPIERRNGTVDMDDWDCAVYLKLAPLDQVALFRAFVDEDLGGGIRKFEFPDPITQAPIVAKFMGDRPYRLRPVSGVEYLATFQLRVFL